MTQPSWSRHYDTGVPASLAPYPRKTLRDCFLDTARERPDHPFLYFKGRCLTHGEVAGLTRACAAGLADLGVRKGDRVAILLPNCPQAIIAQLAAWSLGAVAVPMNPLYAARELEYSLQICGANVAVILTKFYPVLKNVQAHTAVTRVVASSIKEYLPPLLRVLFTLFKEKKEGHRVTLEAGDVWFQDLVAQHEGAPAPDALVSCDDAALMLFTGGTTGSPKAAVATHHALLMAGMQVNAWTRHVLPDWAGTRLMVLPLFHVYGNLAHVASALVGHNPIALVPNPRDLDDIVATIKKVRPAVFGGVPTLFVALLNHPAVKAGKADLRSVQLCVCGGAALLTETKQRFEACTGGRIIEGYSLTEAMLALVASPVNGVNKPGSVGVPLPDVEARIVDADTGEKDLPPGEVGEVILRAPQMMTGYWNAPEETGQMLRNGWLFTGDLAYMDEDGYTFIVDRKKDLIKPSGFQVWPREVEEVVASHPSVSDVAVAGVSDAQQGEAVKAWIVLKPGAAATVDEIRTFCRGRLAAYKVPRHVEFRESLPKTMIGKVLRRALREEAAGRAESA